VSDPRPTPPANRSLLRHRDFLKLWTAETISQFGTQVSQLAIPLVAALILGVDEFEFSLIAFFEFLPFILLTLPAGAWVDRLRRRPILVVGDLGRALMLVSIPIAYELGVLSIWQLYVVGFVNGIFTVFFDISYQSYLPSLVDRDQLVDGNGKLEISRTVAQTAGPAIAGGVIAVLTAPLAILVDALSFLGSAIFIFGIRKHEPAPDRHVDEHGAPRRGIRGEVAQGLRYVLGNRYLRGIAAATGTSNFFSSLFFATYLLYLVQPPLSWGPALIGIVFGIGNVGAIVGAFSAMRLSNRFGLGPTIVGSMFISAPALVIIAIAPPEYAVPLIVIGSGLIGLSAVVYNVNQVSFRQAITPLPMQGRMNATMRFIVWGTMPFGTIAGGVLAQALGVQTALWVGAIGSFLAVVPLVITPVRTLRAMPDTPDEPTLAEIGLALDESTLVSGPAPVAREEATEAEETDEAAG
jgi:MFS family permease